MLTEKKLDLRKSRQEISQDSRAIKKRGHHARLPLTNKLKKGLTHPLHLHVSVCFEERGI